MSTLTFRRFVAGPEAWQPASPWPPFMAAIAALAVLVIGQAAPIAVVTLVSKLGPIAAHPTAGDGQGDVASVEALTTLPLLVAQATLAILTVLVAGLYRGHSAVVLALRQPAGGTRAFIYALVLMAPVLAVVNGLAYLISPSGFLSDFQQFGQMSRTSQPMISFLAIAVGAPVWEELLFRGFLLGSLAGPVGFWPAAAVVSAAWAGMHIGYSIAGLIEVFVIGLYFAWLLRRTGSIWVPVVCHAVYNGGLFLVLRTLSTFTG